MLLLQPNLTFNMKKTIAAALALCASVNAQASKWVCLEGRAALCSDGQCAEVYSPGVLIIDTDKKTLVYSSKADAPTFLSVDFIETGTKIRFSVYEGSAVYEIDKPSRSLSGTTRLGEFSGSTIGTCTQQ